MPAEAKAGPGLATDIVLSLMLIVGAQETCPLPNDPVLAEVAVAVRDARHWAQIVDATWRVVYVTDDLRWGAGAW